MQFPRTDFDALAVLVEVAVTRMEFRNDEDTVVAVGTGTYMVG